MHESQSVQAFSLQHALRPFSKRVAESLRLQERASRIYTKLQVDMTALHGSASALERVKDFVADQLTVLLLTLSLTVLLWMIGGMEAGAGGLLLAVAVPLLAVKRLGQAVHARKREIILELPVLLNKMTLLINAGETVQQAIHRCSEQGDLIGPLYNELRTLSHELRDSRSFPEALEDFSKRCAVQEVAMLSTTILLNYRRGGNDFVLALQDIGRVLWDKRRSVAKTLGEEASSKLVFPMVIIFLIVMVVVASPAILLVGQN